MLIHFEARSKNAIRHRLTFAIYFAFRELHTQKLDAKPTMRKGLVQPMQYFHLD